MALKNYGMDATPIKKGGCDDCDGIGRRCRQRGMKWEMSTKRRLIFIDWYSMHPIEWNEWGIERIPFILSKLNSMTSKSL